MENLKLNEENFEQFKNYVRKTHKLDFYQSCMLDDCCVDNGQIHDGCQCSYIPSINANSTMSFKDAAAKFAAYIFEHDGRDENDPNY